MPSRNEIEFFVPPKRQNVGQNPPASEVLARCILYRRQGDPVRCHGLVHARPVPRFVYLFALLIVYGELAVFRLATSVRSALSNFCLEVDRFRDQLGREIGKNAAE